MAAASAAAIAAMIAIDLAPLEPDTHRIVTAGVEAAEMRVARIGKGAARTTGHRTGQSDHVASSVLTTDSVERALAEAPHERRDLVLSNLLGQLTSQDAPAAAHWAGRQEKGYLREVALRTVAQRWANEEAEAATAWAVSLSDPSERDTMLGHIALELAIPEPERAIQVLARRSVSPSPDSALEGVIQQWASKDFESAYAWADAQAASPDRDALLLRLVFARVAMNPADAAHIAGSAIHDERQRIEALTTIAHRWGARDPDAVREWAFRLDANAQQRVRAELALLE
jgi:hypothetical protein